MKKRIGFVLMVIVMVACLAANGWAQQRTFYAGYNGNTGTGGLDADIGLGGTTVVETAGTPSLIGSGKYGSGLDADYTVDPLVPYAADDRVTYSGGANIPTTGTIEMWIDPRWSRGQQINIGPYGPDQYYFACANDLTAEPNSTGANGLAIGVITGDSMLFREITGGSNYDVWYALPVGGWEAGQWYHLAMSWGSGGVNAYVNGVLVGQNASAPAMAASPLALHISKGQNAWQSADSIIDDVQIWNVERTAAQIQMDMGPVVPEPGSILVMLSGIIGLGGIACRKRLK